MFKERAILVSILTVVLLYLSGLFLPKMESEKIQFRKFWAYKTHRKDKHDLIIMGDSRAYRGISPSEMQKVLANYRIFNFAYSSGRLNNFMYRQTEKRLDLEHGKKIVIIGLAPNVFTKHPDENSHIESQLLLAKEEVYQRIYFAPFLEFFSPVKPESFKKKKRKVNYVETFHNDGWVESNKTPEDTTEAIKSYRQWFEKETVSQDIINDFMRQTKEWTENGFTVFGFRPPSTFTMELLEDSIAEFKENELKIKFENAGGIWIKTSSKDYHSYDGSHLHKDSAIKLSKYLAEEIEKHLNK